MSSGVSLGEQPGELLGHATRFPLEVSCSEDDTETSDLLVTPQHSLLPGRLHPTGLGHPSMNSELFPIPGSRKKAGVYLNDHQLQAHFLENHETPALVSQIFDSSGLEVGEVVGVVDVVVRIKLIEPDFQRSCVDVPVRWDLKRQSLSSEGLLPTLPSPA